MSDRRFKPTEAYKLEDPERLIWLPPSEVLAHMNLQPGMVVADLGAGTGYFSIPISRAVGPRGQVFAVDVEQEMLDKLKTKLTGPDAPTNLHLQLGEAAATHLADHMADRVLIANVWHEIDDEVATLREVERLLRASGQLLILDWRPDVDRPPGPPLEHRIAPEQVTHSLMKRGWKVDESGYIGRYSYFVQGHPSKG
ncbi:MAG: methyltransferase domain-containing protein [Acidobacteriia bacterium]|nr:methyltransferase domain-containing protein [Terriglobia bacterium]